MDIKNIKRKKAITLIEIVISTTIISLLLVAGFGMIIKHSKVLKASSNQADLTYICHKDASGALHKTTIKQDGTKETEGVSTCELKIPTGYSEYRITLIGGGAGGSTSGFDYSYDEFKGDNAKKIQILEKEKAFTPKTTESESQVDLLSNCINETNSSAKHRFIYADKFKEQYKLEKKL